MQRSSQPHIKTWNALADAMYPPPLHEQLGDFFDWFERHLKLLNDSVRLGVRPSQFALYPSHREHQELRSPYVCKKPLSSINRFIKNKSFELREAFTIVPNFGFGVYILQAQSTCLQLCIAGVPKLQYKLESALSHWSWYIIMHVDLRSVISFFNIGKICSDLGLDESSPMELVRNRRVTCSLWHH